MKEIIKGDTEPAHIVAANTAIEAHKKRWGISNQSHPFTYSIKYRNKHYQVEVTTTRVSYLAKIITGHRPLSKVHYGEVA